MLLFQRNVELAVCSVQSNIKYQISNIMESLQEPINPCFYGDESYLEFENLEEAYLLTSSSLEDKMPFLQMLQVQTTSVASPAPPLVEERNKERRKRKRSNPSKNKEEVESQRMTHIAVERNRRRQMNDHLNVIKSLIPASYIQRGDQASIIGSAIDFVKELEQLLECLEAQRRKEEEQSAVSSPTSSAIISASNGVCAELKSEVAEIEVTMIQTHVNLKIKCPKTQGQLLKVIVALEDLSLTILHLNITTSSSSQLPTPVVFYSLNLKIEDECKLGSAEQIAATVHQILSLIKDGRVVNEEKASFRQYSGSR